MTYDVSNIAAVNFNSTLAGIETADAILIVGSHIRWEAALVNARLRKAVKNGAKVFLIGPEWETTYPATFLGNDLSLLSNLPTEVTEAFAASERPALIMAPMRDDIAALDARLAAAAPAGDSQLEAGPARETAANFVEYESHDEDGEGAH